MKRRTIKEIAGHEYEEQYCDRCGTKFRRDKFGIYLDEVAEVVDEHGQSLLVHVNGGCMKDTDKLA